MGKLNIMVVFGTRPEAIKMAPLILELKKHQETINTITVVTAQVSKIVNVLKYFCCVNVINALSV